MTWVWHQEILKDTESKENIEATAIAMDGIAVIVNKNNTPDDITTDQIAKNLQRRSYNMGRS